VSDCGINNAFSGESGMTQLSDAARKRALIMRLRRVEGQIRGVQRLIEEDSNCEQVAQQLSAARKALDKSFYALVGCVVAQGDLPGDDVAELLAKFS
jgi:DNA-binding FrmR family transcriptional regulator